MEEEDRKEETGPAASAEAAEDDGPLFFLKLHPVERKVLSSLLGSVSGRRIGSLSEDTGLDPAEVESGLDALVSRGFVSVSHGLGDEGPGPGDDIIDEEAFEEIKKSAKPEDSGEGPGAREGAPGLLVEEMEVQPGPYAPVSDYIINWLPPLPNELEEGDEEVAEEAEEESGAPATAASASPEPDPADETTTEIAPPQAPSPEPAPAPEKAPGPGAEDKFSSPDPPVAAPDFLMLPELRPPLPESSLPESEPSPPPLQIEEEEVGLDVPEVKFSAAEADGEGAPPLPDLEASPPVPEPPAGPGGAGVLPFEAPPLPELTGEAPAVETGIDLASVTAYYQSIRDLNFYQVLGLSAGAKLKDIRQAYFELVSHYHPDQHREVKDKRTAQALAEVFELLTEAYETLKSKKRRRVYDRSIPEFTGMHESEEEEALNSLFDEAPANGGGNGAGNDHPAGWSFYETALEAFKAGDYHAADLNFKLAAAMEPHRKEYQEGLAQTRKLLSAKILSELKRDGKRLEEERKFHDALAAFARAVEIDPADPELYFALARIRFLKTMDRKRADADVKRLLELDPNHVDGLLLRGRIQVWKGDNDGAVRTFKQVLSITPGHAKARQALELFEKA